MPPLAQIVSEILGLEPESLRVVHPDTDITPSDMATLGSRSTFHMGNAVRLAAEHADYYFLLPDGVSYHGHAVSGGRKSSGGPLALKRELRELITAERSPSDDGAIR